MVAGFDLTGGSASSLRFGINSGATWNSKMVISGTAGNVGINTSNPIARLDVNGTVSISSIVQISSNTTIACAASVSGSIRYGAASNTLQICTGTGWVSLSSDTSAGGGSLTGTGSATAVAYWSGASGLTYDSDGFYWDATNNRLGVGTNNPSETLHIGMSLAKIRVNANGGNAGFYGYNDGSGNHAFSMTRQQIQPGMADVLIAAVAGIGFQPGASSPAPASTKMYMNSSGNLGLGTITPTATLQVSGTFTVSLSTQTTTPSLFVSNSGNVGIGTNAPGYPLDVSGVFVRTSYPTGGASGFMAVQTGSNGQLRLGWDDTALAQIGTTTNHALRVLSNNNERMRGHWQHLGNRRHLSHRQHAGHRLPPYVGCTAENRHHPAQGSVQAARRRPRHALRLEEGRYPRLRCYRAGRH